MNTQYFIKNFNNSIIIFYISLNLLLNMLPFKSTAFDKLVAHDLLQFGIMQFNVIKHQIITFNPYGWRITPFIKDHI
jgi:hypothetical protein